jgi:hypothetical protein
MKVFDVKSVSQPDTMPLFVNNYWFQITETGFAEWFKASRGIGPAPSCLKISAWIDLLNTYRYTFNQFFSHLMWKNGNALEGPSVAWVSSHASRWALLRPSWPCWGSLNINIMRCPSVRMLININIMRCPSVRIFIFWILAIFIP